MNINMGAGGVSLDDFIHAIKGYLKMRGLDENAIMQDATFDAVYKPKKDEADEASATPIVKL